MRRLRLTRQFDNSETIVVRKYSAHATSIDLSDLSAVVGLLDDVAASGSTLIRVAGLAGGAGCSVARVMLCAGSHEARNRFQATARSSKWSQLVNGDWQVVHLRDGCPHLAYSARPTDQDPITGVNGATVEVRVPSYSVLGNHWQVLCMDRCVRDAVTDVRSAVVRELSNVLGRAACILDLSLLGPFVPALTKPGERVTDNVPLERMLA
jgi:hypothetical protein